MSVLKKKCKKTEVLFIMNNKSIFNHNYLQQEIINALKINSTIDWDDKDVNKEFLELIKLVKKLFKEAEL